MPRLATLHARENQPTTNDVTTQPISISASFTKVKWGVQKSLSWIRLTGVHGGWCSGVEARRVRDSDVPRRRVADVRDVDDDDDRLARQDSERTIAVDRDDELHRHRRHHFLINAKHRVAARVDTFPADDELWQHDASINRRDLTL